MRNVTKPQTDSRYQGSMVGVQVLAEFAAGEVKVLLSIRSGDIGWAVGSGGIGFRPAPSVPAFTPEQFAQVVQELADVRERVLADCRRFARVVDEERRRKQGEGA